MSNDDFSDDDDFFESIKRHQLTHSSPQPTAASNTDYDISQVPGEIRSKLFRADGEIAILKSQLESVKSRGYEEIKHLKEDNEETKRSMEEQIKMLKFSVQKLEDEKKFLDNQVKSTFSKKRKLANPSEETIPVTQAQRVAPTTVPVATGQRIIRTQNDTTLLTDYIWKLSINGSDRTIMEYLGKVTLKDSLEIQGYRFQEKIPISSIILEYLISRKNLRLDKLLEELFSIINELIVHLIDTSLITSVPFMLSLLHGILGFKPSAVNENTIVISVSRIFEIIMLYKYTLSNEDRELFNYNKTPQMFLLEKFTLICSMDMLEKLMSLCNLHQEVKLGSRLFHEVRILDLVNQLIPKNDEALMNGAQINIIYNVVRILDNFYDTNDTEETSSQTVHSLLNINLVGVPIKEDFRFYGLNRCIGNNTDFQEIDKIIFSDNATVDPSSLIILPNPISERSKESRNSNYSIEYNHEFHVLDLRLQISQSIENYIINRMDTSILKEIEVVKLMIRSINLQQNGILRSPRSKFVDLRIKIICSFVRNLNYVFKTSKQLNEIINSETLNELSIVLSQIAFTSSSDLSGSSAKLYKLLRTQNYRLKILNEESEAKARELSNVNFSNKNKEYLAEVENEHANGLETLYDHETVELAREILGFCIDNEVADNLYININGAEMVDDNRFDEMDIVNEM
ncbi:lethal, checkpoint-defective, DNA damage sensitive protein [Yamadazyma tenuis]|uniref:DNA damage checkpoint protein LCD1 n=1 Tax=Candida tenuis (strain ATCC 10573 / BCRC 21748 / CBS 615 / JCM 9827 / NBRC 10315 / NRRL Y-1498 / VKM Y-70) TaxID=590646 RepID=G3B0J6_CANTC|nr:uncharacterized protein CANTEDRAFT_97311 [Yamadazyma tenuis ATCC 10573]EGV65415.1 hypothetical protein CANTEDRAFT_97311 [Yamadazyma tenuis ATCC 10573]WEJ94913.1 lethal, checkpoint-defective, DNA damage sensitive protein [Yamadazyma tenuis]